MVACSHSEKQVRSHIHGNTLVKTLKVQVQHAAPVFLQLKLNLDKSLIRGCPIVTYAYRTIVEATL